MSPFEYLYQVCGVEEIVVPAGAAVSATKSGATTAVSAFERPTGASPERPGADAVFSESGADDGETQKSTLGIGGSAQSTKIVFVSSVSRAEYQTNYQTMFEKMVSAMGLDLSQVQLVLEGEEPLPEDQTKVRVDLGSTEKPFGWSGGEDSGKSDGEMSAESKVKPTRHLVVPSFMEMAKNPEFKKIAWQYLKIIKA